MSVIIHCMLVKCVPVDILFEKIIAPIWVVLALLAILLVGLLLEPIANLIFKLPSVFKRGLKEFEFKEWDNQIKNLENKSKEFIDKDLYQSVYQYTKNWILKNGDTGQFDSFLGKYGFYRNLFTIFLFNAIACFFLYSNCIVIIILLLLAILYLHRSRVFYRHMATTVYTQFLVSRSNKLQSPE